MDEETDAPIWADSMRSMVDPTCKTTSCTRLVNVPYQTSSLVRQLDNTTSESGTDSSSESFR